MLPGPPKLRTWLKLTFRPPPPNVPKYPYCAWAALDVTAVNAMAIPKVNKHRFMDIPHDLEHWVVRRKSTGNWMTFSEKCAMQSTERHNLLLHKHFCEA